jgi:hypothetical protein
MKLFWVIVFIFIGCARECPQPECRCECACDVPPCRAEVHYHNYELSASGGGATICCDGCTADTYGQLECRANWQDGGVDGGAL